MNSLIIIRLLFIGYAPVAIFMMVGSYIDQNKHPKLHRVVDALIMMIPILLVITMTIIGIVSVVHDLRRM